MTEKLNKLIEEMKSEILNELRQEIIHQNVEMMKINKEFYTLKEVSIITGLNNRQIKYRYRTGKIKRVYHGNTPLIPSEEVEKLKKNLKRQL